MFPCTIELKKIHVFFSFKSIKQPGHLHYIVFIHLVACDIFMVACIFSSSEKSGQGCDHLSGCLYVRIQGLIP